MKKSTNASIKIKKKMTQDEMRLAIIKKKESDAKAQKIVEKLLEPNIDPEWLIENLKHLNKCHMEDVIEERAITKLCGYVLCKKPITITYNQRYHISLKHKKVYDLTNRKNFCSSSCFGASNYLLEQMLTSPLWLRDKEEIPKFRIFTKDNLKPKDNHGEVVDIKLVESYSKEDAENVKESEVSTKKDSVTNIKNTLSEEISGNINDFVIEALQNIEKEEKPLNPIEENETTETVGNVNTIDTIEKKYHEQVELKNQQKKSIEVVGTKPIEMDKFDSEVQEIQAPSTLEKSEHSKNNRNSTCNSSIEKINNLTSNNDLGNTENGKAPINCDKALKDKINKNINVIKNEIVEKNIDKQMLAQDEMKTTKLQGNKREKTEKISIYKQKQKQRKLNIINLVDKVEQSLKEWITEETVQLLFGDESVKQKAIEKIETQDRYSILCAKLNRLQFEDDQEEAEVLKKPELKPAPHFTVLQEEGKKLELKVRAFFQGKTTFEEPKAPVAKETDDVDDSTYLPLTDGLAPNSVRRKIFLERLDHVLPELIRTLSGYKEAIFSYSNLRCADVKALVQTFNLSPKNIIFNTAEWTLMGLIILKMLSILDSRLTTLFNTKQANMYTSMILTAYKLDPHYLDLLVASYNPNMNPK